LDTTSKTWIRKTNIEKWYDIKIKSSALEMKQSTE
jgi:hypothetical protein